MSRFTVFLLVCLWGCTSGDRASAQKETSTDLVILAVRDRVLVRVEGKKEKYYDVPLGYQPLRATWAVRMSGEFRLTIEFRGQVPAPGGDRVYIEALPLGGATWDDTLFLVYAHSGIRIRSDPPVLKGSAGVIRFGDKRLVAPVNVRREGNKIILSGRLSSPPDDPTYLKVFVYYHPEGVPFYEEISTGEGRFPGLAEVGRLIPSSMLKVMSVEPLHLLLLMEPDEG